MTRPRHIQSDAGYYFVTTGTHDRIPLFQRPKLADAVIKSLYELRSRRRIKVHGFVVMPDHVHAIISLQEDENLPKIMHSLKSYTAHAINDARGEKGKVWQDGYYDYALRNMKDAKRKLQYVLGNPLRKGLVEEFDQYRWSSASGEYEVDPS
jgi:REP element-mobilizing transposase RayT